MKKLVNIDTQLEDFETRFLIVDSKKGYKIVDLDKGIVFPKEKDKFLEDRPTIHEDYLFFKMDGGYRICDNNYNILNPSKQLQITNCYIGIVDDLWAIKVQDNWNYMDLRTGMLLLHVPFKVYDALPFRNGYGVIRGEIDGKKFTNVIDRNGNLLLTNGKYRDIRIPNDTDEYFIAYFDHEDGYSKKANLIDHNENILCEEYFTRYIGIECDKIHVDGYGTGNPFDITDYYISASDFKRTDK